MFLIFILIAINLKNKIKPKKYFFFIIYIKFFIFLDSFFSNNLQFNYNNYFYSVIDINSNYIFSFNNLQNLGYLMYYYYFFWTILLAIFLTFLLIICLNLIIKVNSNRIK